MQLSFEQVMSLNEDIKNFNNVTPVEHGKKYQELKGIAQTVMLDRYAFKDAKKDTLKVGDFVVLTVKEDPKYPQRGFGIVKSFEKGKSVTVELDSQFQDGATITKAWHLVDKPLEVYYEQVAARVAKALASIENEDTARAHFEQVFYNVLSSKDYVPAGRVLYGAGSGAGVTYFNCFSGDTIVQTKYGPMQIKDMQGEYEVYSQDGVIRKAEFKSYGRQELYLVELANGETFKATAGHEWVVVERHKKPYKVTTLELAGKRIPVIPTSHPDKNEDYFAGVRHGIVYGDGSYSKQDDTCHVMLFGEKEELVEFFDDYQATRHYAGKYTNITKLPKDYKNLPENVSNSYWYGFVNGLIATDGHCDARGSVQLSSSKLDELETVRENLYKTGLVASSIKMTREENPYTGEFSPNYRMQLVKATVGEESLLRSSHKFNYINSSKAQNGSIKVVSVTPLHVVEEVYCCNEPETHTFTVGSGILTANCYVMPFPHDSRDGLAKHRGEVMEIMSRGGGVGTNGSTLRPKGAYCWGVNGKSSGAVTWMNDIALLTHLVEQGGSRRGAQMGMLADWHPDILEFIISKMQNPNVLRLLQKSIKDETISALVDAKLKFTPLTDVELVAYGLAAENEDTAIAKKAQQILADGGTYSVNNLDFLTGMNISVTFTHEFMKAVEEDSDWELRFPDIENFTPDIKKIYDEEWHKMGDVREWAAKGLPVRVYKTIKAREMWKLIGICARYSAEPGIFFIDAANDMTNARAYGLKVVATNPCGEQPLAGYSVCNLGAINLANFYDEAADDVNWTKLEEVVRTAVHLQDDVIDSTPYFLEANRKQALGERRVGMGVMGLADLMIKLGLRFGSPAMLDKTDKMFEKIVTWAYDESVEIAKVKGSFPFLDTLPDGTPNTNGREKFINTGFVKKLPQWLRDKIRMFGIRNSHLMTVAPTGTTGTMTGVSTGLEPYFAFKYYRSGRLGKFIPVIQDIAVEYLEKNGYKVTEDNVEELLTKLPDYFVTAMELTPEEHADAQCVIQKWVDSSLSKTCNAPANYTVGQTMALYERLYKGGAKGGTVYVDGSRDTQVLSLLAEENDLDSQSVEDEALTGETKACCDCCDCDCCEGCECEECTCFNAQEAKVVEETTLEGEVGIEIGNICPICNAGYVIDAGGCNTCSNCNAQLKCGL